VGTGAAAAAGETGGAGEPVSIETGGLPSEEAKTRSWSRSTRGVDAVAAVVVTAAGVVPNAARDPASEAAVATGAAAATEVVFGVPATGRHGRSG